MPRINAFWDASLNEGKGGWDWPKIQHTWVERGRREGKGVSLPMFAREIGVNPRMLQVRARQERWKSRLSMQITNERGAIGIETGETYREQLLRMKRDAVLMAEKLMEKLQPYVNSPKLKIAPAKQAVLLLREIVEITREEAKAPENRSHKDIGFKGVLVPAPYATSDQNNGDFIMQQVPGSGQPPPRPAKRRP